MSAVETDITSCFAADIYNPVKLIFRQIMLPSLSQPLVYLLSLSLSGEQPLSRAFPKTGPYYSRLTYYTLAIAVKI